MIITRYHDAFSLIMIYMERSQYAAKFREIRLGMGE
jgi:hypothetical protein